MKGWRLATVLGVLSAGVLASEPAGGPEAELSLELLEFLGEYGNDQGELNLPDDFDEALAEPDHADASTTPDEPAATASAVKPGAAVAVEKTP